MRSYIEANKDFTVKHPPTVFVNTSRGNMLRCTLHLKMIANNRDRLEMAGLLLPVVFEDGAEQVLIDAQTGEMYGATSGCKRKFGIPSELCYGSEKRTGVLNIKQVFPKTSTVEELKEIAETNALMTMDTTLIPAIFQLDRNDPASQDASPFGITANYKQHSVRVRVKEIDIKPENGEITKLLCLEIWKDKSYVQGYATFLHTFSQAAAPNYLTVTGTANQEPSSVSNVGTSQIQSLGSGGNSPSMREAVVEMPMEKEESESEIQRMILYQDRIRKLREKRSQINSNSSTLKVTAFSIGPFMLGVVMIIYFIVSFSLSSSVRSLLEGSVQSQHKLAEMITILPSIATLANRAYLLSTGELQDTQYFNQRSLPQMIKHQQESFQQAENDLRTEILKMVDLDSKWQLETGQFFQSDKLHGDYNTLVSMDLTDATYQLVLSCENIVLLLTNSTSAMIDTRVMADSYQFMYKNYASSFRRYYLYLQGEFKSLYSKLLRSQGNQILFVFIGTLLLFVLIFIGMIMMLFRISEEMMCIPQVMSELKLTDIASALSNLRHYEGDLIKQKVVGNSLYKVSSEINPEDIELESQNFTKTGGVFGRRRSLKNSAQKEKTIVRKELKDRSKSIKKTEMALDAKLPKPPGRISLKGLLLVAQVPKIFRNNINNRARANSGNVIKINAPNHPTAVKTIARQIEVPAVGYKRRMSLSKVKPLSNKQAQDRASIMINKSYHRAVTKMEKRRSLQGKNNSLGSKHNSDDEHLNTEHGKFEEPRVNQKDLEKDSIFSFVKRWQLSLALIGIPFAILAFFQLYQSLSTIDIFQTEITLLANIKVGSSYLTSFTFQNATSGKVFTDGIGNKLFSHS